MQVGTFVSAKSGGGCVGPENNRRISGMLKRSNSGTPGSSYRQGGGDSICMGGMAPPGGGVNSVQRASVLVTAVIVTIAYSDSLSLKKGLLIQKIIR